MTTPFREPQQPPSKDEGSAQQEESPLEPDDSFPLDWHAENSERLTLGQRAADRLRNGMGSWYFIGVFLAFMVFWAVINATGSAWDPYPFILLNLFLSMLAGLQGAILLIAAKRQDAIAAALSRHDYETDVAAERQLEELMKINHLQLAMLRELRAQYQLSQDSREGD